MKFLGFCVEIDFQIYSLLTIDRTESVIRIHDLEYIHALHYLEPVRSENQMREKAVLLQNVTIVDHEESLCSAGPQSRRWRQPWALRKKTGCATCSAVRVRVSMPPSCDVRVRAALVAGTFFFFCLNPSVTRMLG